MDEYIDRNVAIKRIKEYALDVYGIDLEDDSEFSGNSLIENYCEGLFEAMELIDDLDAANVSPVVHGHWIGEGDGYADGEIVYDVWHCSECDHIIDDGTDDPDLLPNYCPNCGAKMDEEATDD